MTSATDHDLDALAATVVGPYLEPLARLHRVLCPRQVLGVRVALLAGRVLAVPFPQTEKRVVITSEIDGCFTDGLMVVSGCSVGHRTLRLVDHGKIAATAIDTHSGGAVRIWPRPGIRVAACSIAQGAESRWHAQRLGYAVMPDADLLVTSESRAARADALLAGWDQRTSCARCGEEIFYGRQVRVDGVDVCRACAHVG